MWIERRIPRLRRHRVLGWTAAALLVGVAIALRASVTQLPPFLTFFPAVVLSAFLGGRAAGIGALIATGIAAPFFIEPEFAVTRSGWGWAQLVGYLITGGLIVLIVDLLDNAITRLRAERERLNLALSAADAGTWEWIGTREIRWDKPFYEVTGLDPQRHPPSLDTYLSHVHPEDLPRMARLRSCFAGEADPAPSDEFRFIRPDGKTVWLLTHRAILNTGGERRIIGVTQDITARKENEMQIALLLREVSHRAKNQYAVVAAVVRETAKKAAPHSLIAEIEARINGLARSQDLLVRSDWEGATVEAVVRAQIDALAIAERCAITGPTLGVAPLAVQYLGMAVYELATNSVKYGALGDPAGHAAIAWSVAEGDDELAFRFEWREAGGPAAGPTARKGFGRTVLEQLTPGALHGEATLRFENAGVTWILTAPGSAVLDAHTLAFANLARAPQAPERRAKRAG